MLKTRLLATTILAAPLFLILSSGAAMAACNVTSGTLDAPADGSTVSCSGVNSPIYIGNSTANYTLDMHTNSSVRANNTMLNAVTGNNLTVNLHGDVAISSVTQHAIRSFDELMLSAMADYVNIETTSTDYAAIYAAGFADIRFRWNANISSEGYGISAYSGLSLEAGDSFGLSTKRTGIYVEGNTNITLGNNAYIESYDEEYDEVDERMSYYGDAIYVKNGGLTFVAGDDLNVTAGQYGFYTSEGLMNVEIGDGAVLSANDLFYVNDANMGVVIGQNASLTARSDVFYVDEGAMTIGIGDSAVIHADSDVFDLDSDVEGFMAEITLGSDNVITAGDNVFEIEGDLILEAGHNTTIRGGDIGLRIEGTSHITLGDNASISGTDDYGIDNSDNTFIFAGEDLSITGGKSGVRINSGYIRVESGINATIYGSQYGVRFNHDAGSVNFSALGAGSVISGDEAGIYNVNQVHLGQGVTVESANGAGIVGTQSADYFFINGTVKGGNGVAIDMGDGNDYLFLSTGASFVGNIDGGAGVNSVVFEGTGTMGADVGLLNIQSVSAGCNSSWQILGNRNLAGSVSINDAALVFQGNVNLAGNLTVASNGVLGLTIGSEGGVMKVAGDANVDGTLYVTAAGTLRTTGTHALVVTQGNVNGEFDTFENTFNYLKPVLRYESNGIFIDFGREMLDIPERTGNTSDRVVAQNLDAYFESNPNSLMDVQNLLTTSTDAQIENLLASQTGQIVLSSMSAAGSGASATSQVALNRVAPSTSGVSSGDVSNPTTYWIQATGGRGKVDSNANANGTKYTSAGTVFGAERSYNANETYGLFAGYSHSNSKYNASALNDKGSTGVYQLGVYGGHSHGAWDFAGTLSGAYMDFETKRPTGLGVAKADFNGGGVFADIEMAYNMVVGDAVNLSPLLALEGSYIRHQSYRENGAGGLNMAVSSDSTKNLTSVLGARAEKTFATDQTALTAALELGWAHQYLDRNGQTQATMIAAPTVSYTTSGVKRDRNSARVGFSLTLAGNDASDNGFTGYVSYNGDFAKNARDQAATIGIRYRW